jgi:hypothetical protein
MRQDSPDESVHATTAPGGSLILTVDKGLGKQFFIVLWLSAFIASVSIVGVIVGGLVLFDSFRVTRQHVKVLEYDLMDLRQKTGHAHENEEVP